MASWPWLWQDKNTVGINPSDENETIMKLIAEQSLLAIGLSNEQSRTAFHALLGRLSAINFPAELEKEVAADIAAAVAQAKEAQTILRSSNLPPLTPEEREAETIRRRNILNRNNTYALNNPRWKR